MKRGAGLAILIIAISSWHAAGETVAHSASEEFQDIGIQIRGT